MKIVYTTFSDIDSAKSFAQKVVQDGLAACANIFPAGHSVYMWQGKLESDTEIYMILKTDNSQLTALQSFFTENHPYETPCFWSVEAEASNDFQQWLNANLRN